MSIEASSACFHKNSFPSIWGSWINLEAIKNESRSMRIEVGKVILWHFWQFYWFLCLLEWLYFNVELVFMAANGVVRILDICICSSICFKTALFCSQEFLAFPTNLFYGEVTKMSKYCQITQRFEKFFTLQQNSPLKVIRFAFWCKFTKFSSGFLTSLTLTLSSSFFPFSFTISLLISIN